MFSLLVAEDEILERKMLEKSIAKECPEINTLYLAKHGLEALAMTREHLPDILLVDINMPGMSGLELIQTLREDGFPGQIIILTAYSDFAYAQKAIGHDVAGYMLKPIDPLELRKNLEKCFKRVTARNEIGQQMSENQHKLHRLTTYVRPQLMREMLSGNVPEMTLRTLCDWPDESVLQCAVLRVQFQTVLSNETYTTLIGKKLKTFDEYLLLIHTWSEESLFIVLQPLDPIPEEKLYILAWMLAVGFLDNETHAANPEVSVSHIIHGYEALRDALVGKAPFVACSTEIPRALIPPLAAQNQKECGIRKRKAIQRLQAGDPIRVFSLFHRMLIEPASCWAGICLFVEAYLRYGDMACLIDLVCQIDQATAPKAIRAFLENELLAHNEPEKENVIIDNALLLMRTRYAFPDFSQVWLAEELGLSQAYFSRLFRKSLGVSFITKLTEIRMEAAVTLLKDGKSVPEAATACGYQSVKYFSNSFRQYHGHSPQQHQKQKENPPT